jgi:hypothetical protein
MGSAPDSESPEPRPARTEWLRGRLISLLVAAVGLYLVWPAPPETVDAWPHLSTIKVRWFVGIVGGASQAVARPARVPVGRDPRDGADHAWGARFRRGGLTTMLVFAGVPAGGASLAFLA